MEKLSFFFLLFSICSSTFAQDFNQLNSNGNRHGIWRKYFNNTKVLRYEGKFNNGKEVGVFKFYKNNKGKAILSATREFSSTSNIATVKFYNEQGIIISEGRMDGKVYIGPWKYYHETSKTLLTLEHYNDTGELNGERLVYYKNGQVAEKKNYLNGQLQGYTINYSLKNTMLSKLYYVDNELHGEAQFYSPNGELLATGKYKKGKKDGVWIYYENGGIKEEKNFTKEAKYKTKKTP